LEKLTFYNEHNQIAHGTLTTHGRLKATEWRNLGAYFSPDLINWDNKSVWRRTPPRPPPSALLCEPNSEPDETN